MFIESSGLVSGDEDAIRCNAVSPRSGVTIDIEAPCSKINRAVNPSPVTSNQNYEQKYTIVQIQNKLCTSKQDLNLAYFTSF